MLEFYESQTAHYALGNFTAADQRDETASPYQLFLGNGIKQIAAA